MWKTKKNFCNMVHSFLHPFAEYITQHQWQEKNQTQLFDRANVVYKRWSKYFRTPAGRYSIVVKLEVCMLKHGWADENLQTTQTHHCTWSYVWMPPGSTLLLWHSSTERKLLSRSGHKGKYILQMSYLQDTTCYCKRSKR